MLDHGIVDDAPVRHQRALDPALDDLGARQIARVSEDRSGRIVEVELGQRSAEIEVGLVEGTDGSDVLPVTLMLKGEHPPGADEPRYDVLAEVCFGPGQRVRQHGAIEHIDAHGCRQIVRVHRLFQVSDLAPVHLQRSEQVGVRRFFHEPGDPPVHRGLHDAEGPGRGRRHGGRRDGDLGPGLHVLLEQRTEVHSVELVTGENEHQAVRVVVQVEQVLADRVGRALVPALPVGALLRREDLDEAG
jgi:hypothetical protein